MTIRAKKLIALTEEAAYKNRKTMLLQAGKAKSIDQIGHMRAVLKRIEGLILAVMPEVPAGTIKVHTEVREVLDRREAELKTIGGTI